MGSAAFPLALFLAAGIASPAVLHRLPPPRIQGVVLDHHGRVRPGAVVFVEGEAQGTVTDGAGRFTLPREDPGRCRIHVRLREFLDASLAARPAADTLRVVLEPGPVLAARERAREEEERARRERVRRQKQEIAERAARRKKEQEEAARRAAEERQAGVEVKSFGVTVKGGECPPGIVCGTVRTRAGDPLPYANVVVIGTDSGAMTDSTGSFAVSGLSPGTYLLRVSYLGYETEEFAVDVSPASTRGVHFRLAEKTVAVMETVVVDAKREVVRKESSATSYRMSKRGIANIVGSDAFHVRGGRGSPAGDPDQPAFPGTLPDPDLALTTAFFEDYGTRPFVDPADDPRATFSVDVDRASYAVARGYLRRGKLPPPAAVRVEEFVNSLPGRYADPEPGSDDAFALHLEAAPSPFREDKVLLRVGLKARSPAPPDRKPLRIVFVVDVSGSMGKQGRMDLVRETLNTVLDRLGTRDRVSMITFAKEAHDVIPPAPGPDPAARAAVAALHPHGGTNAEAGLLLGYARAEAMFDEGAANRVILCSDGVANLGATGPEEILARIGEASARGIDLTAVGFGMGGHNDVLLEKLADRANGNYYYVDSAAEIQRVFVEGFLGAMQTVARDAKVQVELNPDAVGLYRLLGYENRRVADEDFENDDVDAGEVGAGHEVTALLELETRRAPADAPLATVRVRYRDADTGEVRQQEETIPVGRIRGSWNDAEPSWRADAAAAELAEILRGSPWVEPGGLGRALGLAHSASLEEGYPSGSDEFLDLLAAVAGIRPSALSAPAVYAVEPTPVPLGIAHARPNPFRGRTRIGFQLPHEGPAKLQVYDVQGRRVALLLDDVLPAGPGEVEWDGRSDRGSELGSGVYFLVLTDGKDRRTRKVVMSR